MREFLFWAVWHVAWLLVCRWMILRYVERRDRRAGLRKGHPSWCDCCAIHDTWGRVYPQCLCDGCSKERAYVRSGPHLIELHSEPNEPRRFQPAPPPVFGECSGCHLDSIYDVRQPYSKLCGSCVDLQEAKTYNMQTWGAAV